MALKDIFNAITPENIKDIDIINDAMDIFIQNLEENSKISIDIKKILQYKTFVDDSAGDFPENALELRKNVLKMYLSSLYNVLSEVQGNKGIQKKILASNIDVSPLKKEIPETLNDEYLITGKEFKQKIGTELGMEYGYNLAKYLQNNESVIRDFVLQEDKPFHFRTEGSVFKEVYENIVKPLTHPLGFTHSYVQIIQESLIDLFELITEYDFTSIEVRCLDGYIDVFTEDSDDTNVKAAFLERENDLTGELYTEDEYNEYITVHTNKIPQEFKESYVLENLQRELWFTDGTYLKLSTNPIQVYYRNYSDEILQNDEYIKYYVNHCSLFLDYNLSYKPAYTDDIEYFLMKFTPDEEFYDIESEDLDISFHVVDGKYLTFTSGEYLTLDFFEGETSYDVETDEYGTITVTGYYGIFS